MIQNAPTDSNIPNHILAAKVMFMIASMESAQYWDKLATKPYELYSHLLDVSELKTLQTENPSHFKNVITSTSKGHFGMIFGAMWDALLLKERVEWNEENESWLSKVRSHMANIDKRLDDVPTMSLELAILYLKNSAIHEKVAFASNFATRDIKKRISAMIRTQNYTELWALLNDNPEFAYSIWHRNRPDKKTYILSRNQVNRVSQIMNRVS